MSLFNVKVVVEQGDTVPLHLFDRLERINMTLSSTIKEQKLELDKRQFIINEISHEAMMKGIMPEDIHDIIQRINNA